MQGFPFQPEQASTIARSVDYLYYFITAVTLFFSALIFSVIFYFMVKYRRRSPDERPKAIEGSLPLEILWTAIPTLIVALIFVWSSSLYFRNSEPPAGAMEIFVTGKQWMWKIEHPEGQREINELHVPLGRPVKLTMTSEDVIHDFFVPAFRVKKDVLPGRYTSLWFEPTKTGTFHLFCAQYCGAFHAGMIGSIVVMKPEEYERWLIGGVQGGTLAPAEAQTGTPASAALAGTAANGEILFRQSGCSTCHLEDGKGPGPSLLGVYGKPVHLTNGQTVTADNAYIRESILEPNAKIVAGYVPIMPSFQGQLTDEQILDLIAYFRLLGQKPGKAQGKVVVGVQGGTAKAAEVQGETNKEVAPQGGMAEAGEKQFQQSGCSACHLAGGGGPGPTLLGVYGQPVRLTNGQTVTADDDYIRESIVNPGAKIVFGFTPIMPSFQGQLTEEQINNLIAYIRLLGKTQPKPKEEEKP